MKLSISKEIFLKGLQVVQSIISAHTPLPILYNVLLKAEKGKLYLMATDMNISIKYSMDADVKKAGVCTFQARKILDIVHELPQGTVDLEVDSKSVASIISGSATYKLFGIPADDFPPLPSVEAKQSFNIEQLTLKEMFKKTVHSVSVDESRQVLNGIYLSFSDQKLIMVATDGRRLALIEQNVEIPADTKINVILPTKTVNELIKGLGDEGTVKISIQPNIAAFDYNGTLVISKLIEGVYPNYNQVIPSHSEERITLEREGFLAALRRVALVTNDKYPSIKIEITKNQMNISATTPEVGEAQEKIPIKYSGKQITIAFNPVFLTDPLRSLTNDEIYLELVDDLSPAVIKCDIPFLYVLMPLRIE